ncbi:ACP S-malonyltransferase [Actinomadura macrotermitis]|uniref:[acyl-carrier-protein] S-malonyltransferase n=1 Tax=Actinomadura macrotermitis TaxID=2585200 RepID=A0A7K0C8M5_9ACTN|nr:ACP S-malonyltransferase [Actinomadura macrotermitis]MQY09723.1 Malonyl CoA-acyl carrier protein transacylase [Actinomadura macrotermitis]
MEHETGTGARGAVVFPGIGPARFADAAKFMLLNPVARRLTAEADDVLGYCLTDRYQSSEAAFSEAARISFLLNCVALAEWSGAAPEVCAGASFGGIPAAVHTGALAFADAVRMTAEWGRRTEAYFAREHTDVVTLSFARVPEERLAEIRAELDAEGAWHDVACHVDHDFHMLSVRQESVEPLRARLRSAGGLPLYEMRPPMHSAAFTALRDELAAEVAAGAGFRDPAIPIVSDHDGSLVRTADGVRSLLLDAVVRTVRWPAVTATLRGLGVERVHVVGQDALWGRVACMTGNFEIVAVRPETAMRPRRRTAAA